MKKYFYLIGTLTFIVDEPVTYGANDYSNPKEGKITNNFFNPFNARPVENFQFNVHDLTAEWVENWDKKKEDKSKVKVSEESSDISTNN